MLHAAIHCLVWELLNHSHSTDNFGRQRGKSTMWMTRLISISDITMCLWTDTQWVEKWVFRICWIQRTFCVWLTDCCFRWVFSWVHCASSNFQMVIEHACYTQEEAVFFKGYPLIFSTTFSFWFITTLHSRGRIKWLVLGVVYIQWFFELWFLIEFCWWLFCG